MSALVVVFPRGQLMPKDKERLTKHGIVAIESDDPGKVRLLSIEACGLASSDALRCALAALSVSDAQSADTQRTHFVRLLAKSVAAQP